MRKNSAQQTCSQRAGWQTFPFFSVDEANRPSPDKFALSESGRPQISHSENPVYQALGAKEIGGLTNLNCVGECSISQGGRKS